MTSWTDVIVRARGLSGRLLRPAQYLPLCAAGNIRALAAQMAALRLVPPPTPSISPDAHSLELALRRRASARLRILARWAGSRSGLLAPIFDDEDRRSLRALVRGAASGLAPDARLADVIPTPSLPLRALDQLAAAGDVAIIGSLLVAWRHPYGAAVAMEARRQRPELLQVELALLRTFASRAHRAARAGDGAMRRFVARTIDMENLRAAVVLSAHETDVGLAAVFVEGGSLSTVEALRLAARAYSDDTAPAALIAEFRHLALREPLSLAPVILFVLRLRAELRALRRVVWSVSLGVPRDAIERSLGVAA